jgi:hypothetical protein
MPVVIDQFEIVRDQARETESPAAPSARASGTAEASAHPPPLSPVDIEDTMQHLTRRASRLRAT